MKISGKCFMEAHEGINYISKVKLGAFLKTIRVNIV